MKELVSESVINDLKRKLKPNQQLIKPGMRIPIPANLLVTSKNYNQALLLIKDGLTIRVLLDKHYPVTPNKSQFINVIPGPGYIDLSTYKERTYGIYLFNKMPTNWKGRTWINLETAASWQGGEYDHLLDMGFVPHKTARKYIYERDKTKLYDEEGKPTLSLRMALTKMHSVKQTQCTIAGFPYALLPREYLIWLVSNGELPNGKKMKTAETTGPINILRESILFFLDSTKAITKLHGNLEALEDLPYIDPLEPDYHDFASSGYWETDKFISSGTAQKIKMQNHGTPIWLEIINPKEITEEKEMDDLPREEKTNYESLEKLQLGWAPPRTPEGKINPPKTLNEMLKRLFQNKNRLANWETKLINLEWKKGMSRNQTDQASYEQEVIDHETLLGQITAEYKIIIKTWHPHIEKPWGMKTDILLAEENLEKFKTKPENKLLDIIRELLEPNRKNSLQRKILSHLINLTSRSRYAKKEAKRQKAISSIHLEKISRLFPAIGFTELRKMKIPKEFNRELKDSIKMAKLQTPKLKSTKISLEDANETF